MSVRRPTERGDATTETVLAVPVLMLIVLLVIQFGLWYHASHVAEAAAQEGVRATRSLDGSAEAGQARAEAFLDQNAAFAEAAVVSASRDDEIARVEVTASLDSIVPGLSLPIRALAESPVERFREDDR